MLKHRSLRSRGAVGVRVDARVQPFASFSRWYTQIRSQYPTVKKRLSGDFLYILALGASRPDRDALSECVMLNLEEDQQAEIQCTRKGFKQSQDHPVLISALSDRWSKGTRPKFSSTLTMLMAFMRGP